MIWLMDNPIRDYAWGSTTALAALQNREATGRPEAELWMGAHPSAPSALLPPDVDEGTGTLLPDAVAADPDGMLGAALHARTGPRLAYMLKILAIAEPLSLQVHPDAARAAARYGTPGSPYVDPYAKPELLHAIETVEALFGFRPAATAAALIGALDVPALDPVLDALAGAPEPSALRAALRVLTGWPDTGRAGLVADVAAAALARLARGAGGATELRWVHRLAELYPGDPMVLAPLLLDMVRLAPGESLFVPAGVPHSYLSGAGVEVLAASDNVVRAGLTRKPVDVAELLAIVDCTPHPVAGEPPQKITEPEQVSPYEVAWRPKVADFQLTRVRVPAGVALGPDPRVTGPQVLVCTHGKVQIARQTGPQPERQVGLRAGRVLDDPPAVTLTAGRSAFAAAGAGPLVLTGEGELFRAAPGVVADTERASG